MAYEESLARVRERGGYDDSAEAAQITEAVLAALGNRMQLEAAGKLGEQLPEELAQTLTGSRALPHKLVAVHRLLDLPSETLNRTRGFA